MEGYGPQVISPGQTGSFRVDRNYQSCHYEAETNGCTLLHPWPVSDKNPPQKSEYDVTLCALSNYFAKS